LADYNFKFIGVTTKCTNVWKSFKVHLLTISAQQAWNW